MMLANITGDMLDNNLPAPPTMARSRFTFDDDEPDHDGDDLLPNNATLVVVTNAALKAQCE